MFRILSARWPEITLSAAAILLLYIQVFSPAYIGIGNNGDFSKVCMQYCLGPVEGWGDNFKFFEPDYTHKPQYCWKSEMRVTEYLLAGTALRLARHFGAAEPFNIRWVGFIHSALLLSAFWLFLFLIRQLPDWKRLVLGGLAIWIFFDIRYVSYLNSFYMDTAAFIGAFFVVLFGWALIRQRRPAVWALLLFSAAVYFYALSKSAHGAGAAVAAALPLALMPGFYFPVRRAASVIAAGICITAAYTSLALTPASYKGQALYNVIFFDILDRSPQIDLDAEQLGVSPDNLRFVGTFAYAKGSPGRNLAWVRAFSARTGFGKVARYYLAHPGYVAADLWHDLKWAAWMMRSPGVSNYRREQGRLAGTLSDRFSTWTWLRSSLYWVAPWHVVLYLGAVVWLAGRELVRRIEHARVAGLLLGIVFAAAIEFGIACLADAVETDRHLFIFHTLVDISVLFLAVCLVSRMRLRTAENTAAQAALEPEVVY